MTKKLVIRKPGYKGRIEVKPKKVYRRRPAAPGQKGNMIT